MEFELTTGGQTVGRDAEPGRDERTSGGTLSKRLLSLVEMERRERGLLSMIWSLLISRAPALAQDSHWWSSWSKEVATPPCSV